MDEMNNMNELKNLFLEKGVPSENIDDILAKLGFTCIDNMVYLKSADQLVRVGVHTILAQERLLEFAQNLRDEKAKSVEAAKNDEQKDREPDTSLLADDITDDDWINALEQEGFLKFESYTYIAGIKAVLAMNIGVFEAVEKLTTLVNDFAVKNALPAPLFYYDLRAILTRREYGLIFAVSEKRNVDGVPIYATSDDITLLMDRIQRIFIPSILEAANALSEWFSKLTAMSQADFFLNATAGMDIPRNSYPSTADLRDAGKSLRIHINQTFAGDGIQKALAIHNEYESFVKILNDEKLASSVGAVNRDAVLALLGFDPNAAAVRSERYIVKFIMSMIRVEELADANELVFFRELYNLMRQIDWSALTGNPSDHERFNSISNIPTNGQPQLMSSLAAAAPAIASLDSPRLTQMDGMAVQTRD